jgi:hypothetical protein
MIPQQVTICPCCGAQMSNTPPAGLLVDSRLTPRARSVVEIMLEYHPRPVTKKRLIERLYEDDADGGPENTERNVRYYIRQLRKKLSPHGWTISLNAGGVGYTASYRLIPLGATDMIPRRAAKRDVAEPEVVSTLVQCGFGVERTGTDWLA